VSIPDAARKIEPKRAATPGVRAAKTDPDIHIRNRTAGYPSGAPSRIHESGYSGPEWAGTPPSLHFRRLVRKDAGHALRAKTFTCGQDRVSAQQQWTGSARITGKPEVGRCRSSYDGNAAVSPDDQASKARG